MADKFGLGPGPHELKIGSSFSDRGPGKFHTIRYDFKPASVDPTKKGMVDIGESNSLKVKVPHSNGPAETNYNGHLKSSSQKECVLIIDRTTGEITLEKLSGHMLLKKTRQERPEKATGSGGGQGDHHRLVNNVPNPSSSSLATANMASSSSSSSSRPQTPVTSFKRDSPAATPKPLSRSASPHIPSNPTTLAQAAASVNKVNLSESSSSSSSSGSDSDSDFDDVPAPSVPFQGKKTSAASAPVVNPSMPSFLDSSSPPRSSAPLVSSTASVKQPRGHHHQPQSMPQILNDDLQLSESDDDSD